ncbi:M23 family metallopeptidase [Algoriphagus halophilus]|uniref:Peptidase family M23 n=1 Tax=Algoriphagus halophilus TaxID=226505 RepID=A0A1N6FLT3_9BACT|nr:M23 family metallopeptidase [Algoriphagus halophilus]SIN96243.1 Peptidase family M23 [Algoriphagus halophilus]
MKRIQVALLTFLFCSKSFAQITVESDRQADGSVDLSTVNTAEIPYTVLLNFSSLENLSTTSGNVVVVVAMPGKNRATTLKRIQENASTNYRYSISYVKGNMYGKNKVEPTYFFPVREGEKILAQPMTHLENRLQPKEKNNDYVGLSFKLEGPTEIVAPRKGVISSMNMGVAGQKENLDFQREENFIEIYHEDGSFTKIMVLKTGSQQVKVGDPVLPGQVIATSAGENYNSGAHVRMVNLKPAKDGVEKLKYEPFPVRFATSDGTIEINQPESLTVAHPDELITVEMSKRELKKYKSEKQ